MFLLSEIKPPMTVRTLYDDPCERTFGPILPTNEVKSIGCELIFEIEPPIPAAFFEALQDFKQGRTVDLDTALIDLPPSE
jgi:hypothetical protein